MIYIQTEKILRSLLQKAVRRGDNYLAESVFTNLYVNGSKSWLKHRLAIIAAEECWPLCLEINPGKSDFRTLLKLLKLITSSVKNKSAAGLGSLAYQFNRGHTTIEKSKEKSLPIRIVSEGLNRPVDFWGWVRSQTKNEKQSILIENAQYFYSKGGLPWDKAFFVAAVYLSIFESNDLNHCLTDEKIDIPLWSAFDKHSKNGRYLLKRVSDKIKLSYDILGIVNFYIEGCKVNKSEPSHWWDKEIESGLSAFSLTKDNAIAIWSKAKPFFLEEVSPYTNQLQDYLDGQNQHQLSMLNGGDLCGLTLEK